MVTIDTLFLELEGLWAKKRPEVSRGLRPGATAEDCRRFEGAVGCSLEHRLAKLYGWHDGSNDEHRALEGHFGWSSLTAMASTKRELDDLERSGDFTDNGWASGSWWNLGWLPFLQFNSSEYVCVDSEGSLGVGRGAVFIRWNADESRIVLAPSLESWLEAHVAITAAGPASGTDDDWLDHFEGEAARRARERVSPGFPKVVAAR